MINDCFCVAFRRRKGSLSPNKGSVDTSDFLATNEVSLYPSIHNLQMHKNRNLHTSYILI